jgi:hypothetical protein
MRAVAIQVAEGVGAQAQVVVAPEREGIQMVVERQDIQMVVERQDIQMVERQDTRSPVRQGIRTLVAVAQPVEVVQVEAPCSQVQASDKFQPRSLCTSERTECTECRPAHCGR